MFFDGSDKMTLNTAWLLPKLPAQRKKGMAYMENIYRFFVASIWPFHLRAYRGVLNAAQWLGHQQLVAVISRELQWRGALSEGIYTDGVIVQHT